MSIRHRGLYESTSAARFSSIEAAWPLKAAGCFSTFERREPTGTGQETFEVERIANESLDAPDPLDSLDSDVT